MSGGIKGWRNEGLPMAVALAVAGSVSPAIGQRRLTEASYSLHLDQQPRRLLDRFLDPPQECHRFAAVDDAMIVGERDVHHRPDDDLARRRRRAGSGSRAFPARRFAAG